jgi:hypothetical protein
MLQNLFTNTDLPDLQTLFAEINTDMGSYLFNGEKMNAGYNNTTIKDLFSSITYNNNNYIE